METIKNGNLRIENIWNEKFSGQNRRLGTTGDKINGLGYITIESIQSETKRGKKLKKKNEQSFIDFGIISVSLPYM